MSLAIRVPIAALAAAVVVFAAGPASTAGTASTSGIDLKAMDTSVSPCQNFYQYACGTWRKTHPIPPDRPRWSRFDELQERNLQIERDILEKAAEPSAARTPVEQKIGDFYASCMDEAAIDAKGIEPIAPMLDRIAKLTSKQQLPAELARLHDDRVLALFTFYVRPDAKHASENIASVDQGGLGLPDRDYYLRTDPRSVKLRQQYEQHIKNMLGLLAKARNETPGNEDAQVQAIMKIETALAKASMERVARRNPNNTYHKMTVAELASLTPDFNWNAYLTGAGIRPVQTLNVAVPDFVKALAPLLADTSLDDLKTYLTWHALAANAEQLPAPFQEEDFAFNGKILRGTKEMPARWKRCVQATDHALGEALGQKFVEVAFSGPSKAKALELVHEIEKEMGEDIRAATWMSPDTKKQALAKLAAVTNKIGYPDKWRDYSSVKIVRGDYFGNALRAVEFEVARNHNKLGKPVDKAEWSMTPPTVNAYYAPPMNNINFPAGILQPPFYNAKAPDAVNYGAIGVVIGHELTHGFDDNGRRYDGEGNLRDWWTPQDEQNFIQRANCIANEYSNFSPAPGVKLNGKLTLGENAADNGGIHLAYLALMDHLAGRVLPKSGQFTPEQQFFLGYGQIWCENTTEQAARLQALTNPHSPGEFRVNGVVQNSPEFQKAFSCKVGDAMVAPDPCRVW